MKMIMLDIIKTSKGYNPKDRYIMFDSDKLMFYNIKKAKEWLKEEYGNCKREKIYRDDERGKAINTGYIYCFRNSDISHLPIEKWLQQDWVEFKEVKYMNLREACNKNDKTN